MKTREVNVYVNLGVFLVKYYTNAKRELYSRKRRKPGSPLSFAFETLLSSVFEHKAYEIMIYGINKRNLEGIARVTDSNFSLERNRAIISYVVRVNSHMSVYMHFCVPS